MVKRHSGHSCFELVYFETYVSKWKLSTPLKILLRQSSSREVERHSGHSCFGLVYFDMFQIETFNPIENTSEAIFIEFEGG